MAKHYTMIDKDGNKTIVRKEPGLVSKAMSVWFLIVVILIIGSIIF